MAFDAARFRRGIGVRTRPDRQAIGGSGALSGLLILHVAQLIHHPPANAAKVVRHSLQPKIVNITSEGEASAHIHLRSTAIISRAETIEPGHLDRRRLTTLWPADALLQTTHQVAVDLDR